MITMFACVCVCECVRGVRACAVSCVRWVRVCAGECTCVCGVSDFVFVFACCLSLSLLHEHVMLRGDVPTQHICARLGSSNTCARE